MIEGLLIFYQYPNRIWPLLENTGLVARIVLLILLVFSVLSWAIIIHKSRRFNAAQRESREFLKVFRQSKKLTEMRIKPIVIMPFLYGVSPSSSISFNPSSISSILGNWFLSASGRVVVS